MKGETMKKQNSGNNAKHRYWSLMVLSCGLCLTAHAVDFPSAGGNLADPEAWGGSLPGVDAGIVVNQSGTYTATNDIEFGSLTVNAQGITFDFASGGNHRIRLADGGNDSFRLLAPTDSLTSFLGGIWDFAGGTPYLAYASQGQIPGKDVLFDGCCWTNLNRLTIARGTKAHSTELLMRGGARVFTKELFVGNTSPRNILRIADGSSVVVDNGGTDNTTVYVDNDNNGYAPQNAIYVEGSGSALDVRAGKTVLGHKDMSGILSVTDGATASFGELIIGNNISAQNNCMFVGNGASVTIGTLTARGIGCSLVVSNATLTLPNTAQIGGAGYSNFTFRAIGASTAFPLTFTNEKDVFCDASQGNVIALEQGMQCNVDVSPFLCYGATGGSKSHNVLRVESNAKFMAMTTVNFGERIQASSVSNQWVVAGGGVVDLPELRMSGIGNRLVVDSGYVFCTNRYAASSQILRFGYKHPKSTDDPVDVGLVLKGASPKVYSTSNVTFANGACLRFEIPQAGYEAGHCPLTASQVTFDAGTEPSRIEVDCADWLRAGGGTIKLAQVSTNNGLASLEPALANASLPSGCRLCIKNNALFLKNERGFILSFR